MTKSSEEWWDVFRRASALRHRLLLATGRREPTEDEKRKGLKKLEREKKRAEIQAIKKDAFELLNESSIPQPLRMLIVDLWGGSQTVIDRYPWVPEKMAAALIEASQPKPKIGYKRLTTLLRNLACPPQTGPEVK